MIQYPLSFKSETVASNGVSSLWKTRSQYDESNLCIPPEFLGPGGALSPEDLFNQALTNCFVATFKVFAENSKLSFEKLTAHSQLIVDLDEKKRPVMKEFFLKVEISNPSSHDKALVLAKKASETGFILNSVKTICHFDFKVM